MIELGFLLEFATGILSGYSLGVPSQIYSGKSVAIPDKNSLAWLLQKFITAFFQEFILGCAHSLDNNYSYLFFFFSAQKHSIKIQCIEDVYWMMRVNFTHFMESRFYSSITTLVCLSGPHLFGKLLDRATS